MTYRSASSRAAAFDDALREAMSTSVTERFDVEGAPAPDPAAGTPRTERISTEDVAALARIMDADSAAANCDRVKRHWQASTPHMSFVQAKAEHERQARLRRWQEQR